MWPVILTSHFDFFSRALSAQAICDLDSVPKEENVVQKLSKQVGDAVNNDDHPVLIKVHVEGSRSSSDKVSSLVVEVAHLMALRKHIQKLQAENEDLLSRRSWYIGLRWIQC